MNRLWRFPNRFRFALTLCAASRSVSVHFKHCNRKTIVNFFRKIFPTKNDRDVKKIRPVVARINEIEAGLQKLSDDELRAKTAAWKAELSQIEDNAELARKLDEILPGSLRRGEKRLPPAVRAGNHRARSSAEMGDDPVRRAAHRRLRAAHGAYCGNGHRRRQNARRHAARLSQRAHRARRPSS